MFSTPRSRPPEVSSQLLMVRQGTSAGACQRRVGRRPPPEGRSDQLTQWIERCIHKYRAERSRTGGPRPVGAEEVFDDCAALAVSHEHHVAERLQVRSDLPGGLAHVTVCRAAGGAAPVVEIHAVRSHQRRPRLVGSGWCQLLRPCPECGELLPLRLGPTVKSTHPAFPSDRHCPTRYRSRCPRCSR